MKMRPIELPVEYSDAEERLPPGSGLAIAVIASALFWTMVAFLTFL